MKMLYKSRIKTYTTSLEIIQETIALRAACCQQGGVSFETVVGIYRLTDALAHALCSEHVGYR